MPITILHFGLLAPVNHLAKKRVSNVSFILVNLWIDQESIYSWFNDIPLPSHAGGEHAMVTAAILAVLVAMVGVRSMPWVLGAYLGAVTHILLDGLVHPEMRPFEPVMEGNPLYMGWMQPVSLVLLPLTIWHIAQMVSCAMSVVRRRLGARFPVIASSSDEER